ncbi:MAG: thiamine phosphate synthase [Hyphomicrobium sp.]
MAEPARARIARFYPIVPDARWAARLAPLGVKTMQLRIKGQDDFAVHAAVSKTLELAREYSCQIIINDYWQIAIDTGADFIHLGQEDLAAADLKAIRRAGLRVGVSTHDEAELDAALAAKADYVALGPIYETKLKAMCFGPQGLARIGDWKRRIGDTPLVAIGGITPDLASDVYAAGADSIAAITDFIMHPDPEDRVRLWLSRCGGAPKG